MTDIIEDPTDLFPEPTPEPEPTPQPTLRVHLKFDKGDDSPAVNYANILDHPATLTAEQYAKVVAEQVERTILLHTGALPVLAKVEPA